MYFPEIICRAVIEFQDELNWPELVPHYIEGPKNLWHSYESITVGLCTQLTEFHVRKARQKLSRFMGSPRTAKAIARHIVIARILRCLYISLMGQENTTENDMPFAYLQIPK